MSEPTKPMFLTRTLYVSATVYEALQALAEMEQAESPDHIGTALLTDLLQKNAELNWLVQRRRSDREKLREEYATRLQAQRAQEEDKIEL